MLLTFALLSALNAAPAADSIPGSWQIKGDVSGTTYTETCTIARAGNLLSGVCKMEESGDSRDLTGEVKDGKITFQHGGDYQGTAITIIYVGTLDSPKELKGTVDVPQFNASGTFTAAPAAAPSSTPAPAKP